MLKDKLLKALKERNGQHTDSVDVCGLLPEASAGVTMMLLNDLIKEGKVLRTTSLRNNYEAVDEGELIETPSWMKDDELDLMES